MIKKNYAKVLSKRFSLTPAEIEDLNKMMLSYKHYIDSYWDLYQQPLRLDSVMRYRNKTINLSSLETAEAMDLCNAIKLIVGPKGTLYIFSTKMPHHRASDEVSDIVTELEYSAQKRKGNRIKRGSAVATTEFTETKGLKDEWS